MTILITEHQRELLREILNMHYETLRNVSHRNTSLADSCLSKMSEIRRILATLNMESNYAN